MKRDPHNQTQSATPSAATEQERGVADVIAARGRFAGVQAFVDALWDRLHREVVLEPTALARVAEALAGEDTDAVDAVDAVDVINGFWTALANHFPGHGYVAVLHGKALFGAGRERAGMAQVLRGLRIDPGLIDELDAGIRDVALARGGEIWLHYQLAELRADLAAIEFRHGRGGRGAREQMRDQARNRAPDRAPDPDRAADEGDDDSIRERYSELLDVYCDDPEALQQIREVGAVISRLEREGVLPQCLIRRGSSRR